MWTYEHSIDTTATPAAVWTCYATTAVWPEWDKEVRELALDGELAAGTTGTLTLHGLPPTPIAVTDATSGIGFTCETRVPDGTILRFTHRLAELPGGTRITHHVEIDGPSAAHTEFCAEVTQPIPDTMRRLAEIAVVRAG